MTASSQPRPSELLRDLYSAATAAVAPGPALQKHLKQPELPAGPVRIIAMGKASVAMAETALDHLRAHGMEPVGGIVIGPAPVARSDLPYVKGDHPEPGPGSLAAASALAEETSRVTGEDEVWVLLSGGTTSLVGAPETGLHPADLVTLYSLLLGSGLDITAMNRIRKRFSRWGAGKLARALAPARVRVYVVSDVIGDDLESIGSGPCVPDPTTAAEVRALLDASQLWRQLPRRLQEFLRAVERGSVPETPKPGDPVFARVTHEVIASNRLALEVAARRAAELGLVARIFDEPIAGEASLAGTRLASHLREVCADRSDRQFACQCLIWGGETTVTLGEAAGLGGRCQELALSAARVLHEASRPVSLLAAGTDGRDGPTDAAGAVVDGETWTRIIKSGRDPERDLASHDAYHSLDAAGVLLRPGLTGTNVMDVVIGLCGEGKTGAEKTGFVGGRPHG